MAGNRRHNPSLLLLGNPAKHVSAKQPLGPNGKEAYESFHWSGPAEVLEVDMPDGIDAKELVLIGYVDCIQYTTRPDSERSKIGKAWEHRFKDKPMLLTTPQGDVVIVIGDSLSVTPRGIEG